MKPGNRHEVGFVLCE